MHASTATGTTLCEARNGSGSFDRAPKSGATHQIDVFWTFEIAGQRYQTCIECKHYSAAVKKSHVASFATVLADIGNANGIFVTTKGYQKGAKLLAAQTDIRLILLNPTIQAFELTVVLQIPRFENFKLQWDEEACKPLLAAAGVEGLRFTVDGRTARLRKDATGEETDLAHALAGKLNTPGPTVVDLTGLSYLTDIGWMPLKSATFDLAFDETSETQTVRADRAVRAILEDVLANTRSYVDDQGRREPVPANGREL